MNKGDYTMQFADLSMDAEMQTIQAVAILLKDVPKDRKIALLSYLIVRYQSGDNFGRD
jgi:hypothetical protein